MHSPSDCQTPLITRSSKYQEWLWWDEGVLSPQHHSSKASAPDVYLLPPPLLWKRWGWEKGGIEDDDDGSPVKLASICSSLHHHKVSIDDVKRQRGRKTIFCSLNRCPFTLYTLYLGQIFIWRERGRREKGENNSSFTPFFARFADLLCPTSMQCVHGTHVWR